MKLIRPYTEILFNPDGPKILQNIERAGRTCYKSEDKISEGSALEFIKMLINRGHESVLEHEKISVLFVCDRGVSHELVRHRIASFSQESTRYCNYSKDKHENQLTFIIPDWLDISEGKYYHQQFLKNNREPSNLNLWIISMLDTEFHYIKLINKGWRPEQARSILPNSLKTEIVVTANLREWRLIFKQRTSNAAHPQMSELMLPLLLSLKQIIPVVFDDIPHA